MNLQSFAFFLFSLLLISNSPCEKFLALHSLPKIVHAENFVPHCFSRVEFMDEVDVPSSAGGYYVDKKMWTAASEERLKYLR